MSFNFKIHSSFKLNNVSYNKASLIALASKETDIGEENAIHSFLLDFLNTSNTITVHTSGSTATPKAIELKKEAMLNSAKATGLFFNLLPAQKSLLCLPTSYIAGKMMLVRAMVLGLHIDTVTPKITFKLPNKIYDFVAMIPSQVEANIDELTKVKTLIVGGGAVSYTLKEQLQPLSTKIYETYGMTETVTHIALKCINGDKATNLFTVLPNINITTDSRSCLVINAPSLLSEPIITNDIVSLDSVNTFKWLGRFDNVINSGGVKLFPEQIETKLRPYINSRYFIIGQKDAVFSEVPVLVIEAEEQSVDFNLIKDLTKIETPKFTYFSKHFIETSSGKVKRKATFDSLIN